MLESSPVLQPAESDATDGAATAGDDARSVCPLCGAAAADATELYTHLQVGHRKSALARLITDR